MHAEHALRATNILELNEAYNFDTHKKNGRELAKPRPRAGRWQHDAGDSDDVHVVECVNTLCGYVVLVDRTPERACWLLEGITNAVYDENVDSDD